MTQKKNFSCILNQKHRYVVIHDTYSIFDKIVNALQNNDIVFFDDCLYSQYVFLKENNVKLKEKNIRCVISFSSGIYRSDSIEPIYEANCAEYHNKIHSNDKNAYAAYMSIDEIKELLTYDNVYLACHGFFHLDLNRSSLSKKQQYKLFLDDIQLATEKLENFGFKTNIFVYPYAYDDFLFSEYIVRKYKYSCIFAGKNTQRIQIEELL